MPPTGRPNNSSRLKLTEFAASAGCAAKLSQMMLREVLRRLPAGARTSKAGRDPHVLVDSSTFDDAGVYQLRADLAIVQTVDFFTPIVNEPRDFGAIAAANALSDVYAMGGRPITAMNLLGVPADKLNAAAIAAILAGGAAKVREAKCALVGGHTIKTAEPIYGLSVTGLVHPKRILTNAAARPGDLIVLTKPLGVGIATTAIKRGLASPKLASRAAAVMKRLNVPGADLAEAGLVKCATDVTGFGLTGHLGNVVRASNVAAEIDASAIPILAKEVLDLISAGCVPGGTRSNLEAAGDVVEWGKTPEPTRILISDVQTSGPLLLFVAPRDLSRVLDVLKRHRTFSAQPIGRVVRGRPRIRIL